jgi:G:T-mismatch repair DNA endonuclease (very short patch repair protein)
MMSTRQRGKPQPRKEFIRVPISILGPLWMVVATVGGMWFQNYQSNAERDKNIVAVQKDLGYLNKTVVKIEKKLDDSNANNVTRVEMLKELATIKEQLKGVSKK